MQRQPLSEDKAWEALQEICAHIHPRRNGKHRGYKESSLNSWTKSHLQGIQVMLNLYMGEGSETKGEWMKSSQMAVWSLGKKPGHARFFADMQDCL